MHMKYRLNHHKLAQQDLRTRREPDPQQVLLRNIEPKAQDGMGRANMGPRDKALQ